jgi:chromate reductase, NAD(P)H dehydrogenase (quinone)
MSDTVRVLGVSGSLRKASFNTALLRAAMAVAPPEVQVTIAAIGDIPHYDEDVHQMTGFPAPVVRFREQVAQADALLIATPEFNYSVPGVLKNAIDWASRAPKQPFGGKPLAIMGVSGAMSGTMRAQYHLRQICVFLDMHPINRPEIFVRNGATAFDETGAVKDEALAKALPQMWTSLVAWTRRLQGR